jgi:hypothetical protein
MRFSEWRAKAPASEAGSSKVAAIVEAALTTLGADRDPECWVAWGDDPAVRYLLLAPTSAGLVQLNVRVNVAGEGPRASGKVVRWARVQTGELGVEIQGGHRLVTFQVDTLVLNGVDESADRISAFAQSLFAAIDGRPMPPPSKPTAGRVAGRDTGRAGAATAKRGGAGARAGPGAAKPAAKPAAAGPGAAKPARAARR